MHGSCLNEMYFDISHLRTRAIHTENRLSYASRSLVPELGILDSLPHLPSLSLCFPEIGITSSFFFLKIIFRALLLTSPWLQEYLQANFLPNRFSFCSSNPIRSFCWLTARRKQDHKSKTRKIKRPWTRGKVLEAQSNLTDELQLAPPELQDFEMLERICWKFSVSKWSKNSFFSYD